MESHSQNMYTIGTDDLTAYGEEKTYVVEKGAVSENEKVRLE